MPVFEQRKDSIATEAGAVLLIMAVGAELVVCAVIAAQATVGTHPQGAASIFIEIPDDIIPDAGLVVGVVLVANERFRGAVEAVESSEGSQPQLAFAVFEDIPDVRIAQALGVTRVMLKVFKRAALLIKSIEPAEERAHPEMAPAVLEDRKHGIGTETLWIAFLMLIRPETLRLSIITIKASFGADPEDALLILE